MTRGGRAFASILVVVSATTGVLVLGTVSLAACAPPHLTVTPTAVQPGQTITVAGTGFVCTTSGTGEAPVVHLDLKFVQGSFEQRVAAVDTGGSFTVPTTIPSRARGGSARIDAVGRNVGAIANIRVLGALAHTGDAPSNDVVFFAAVFLIAGMLTRAWANAPF